MDVVCPQCNAAHRVPDEKVPAKGALLTCKRCSHKIKVKPLETDRTLSMPTDTPPAVPQAAPSPAAPMQQALPDALLSYYPQAAGFSAAKYRMTHILKPNKKGSYKTGLNTLKMKLLSGIKPTLDKVIAPDEQVVCVAAGTAHYPLELIFGNGWFTMLYNRYVLVATNQRLLAFNTNLKSTKVTHYLFQFTFDEITKVSKGIFGTVVSLKRKRGKTRTFTGIKRALAKEMAAWIGSRIDPQAPVDATGKQCDNLCPACYKALPAKLAACPNCRAAFKTPKRAALRSLLVPGWGDIYLGHRFLGTLELLGSLFVWLFAVTMVSSGEQDAVVIAGVVLLFVNGMDALLTLHMASKGLSLEKKQPMQQVGARAGVGAA